MAAPRPPSSTSTTAPSLEQRVQAAVAGDADALEAVILAIKDDIYGLALRMLWNPADAEDATQEVLIRVCTALSTFEGRSAFRTWVYRVAVRCLLNVKRGRVEPPSLSFEDFAADLREGFDDSGATTGAHADLGEQERALLTKEVRIGCTQAMLLCLDRDHRLAYLLGEILGLDGGEGAEILEVSAPTFRKRLSRARKRVEDFTRSTCGLVGSGPCRCSGRIAPAVASGRVDPSRLLFAIHPVADVSSKGVAAVIEDITQLRATAKLMRSNPRYRAPHSVYSGLLTTLRSA